MDRLGSERAVYEGRVLTVADARFRRADGTEVDRTIVRHPGSVAIVAHDDEAVHLVAQPREAVGEDALLEIPAGTLDVEGESPLECAKRELAEEAHLAAAQWSELHRIYASPGYTDEVVWIFLATELEPREAPRDADEDIEIVRLPLAELDAALPRIRDASTLVGLLLLRERLGAGA